MVPTVVMSMCDPNAKVGAQALRDNIAQTTAADFQKDMARMLEHIQTTVDLIKDMGETHACLLKDTFNVLRKQIKP